MGSIEWLRGKFYERKLKSWAETEQNRLSILEMKIMLKLAKLNVQRQKFELRILKQEEEKRKRARAYYIH